MNKMIGKISNKDWSGAPEGATHTFRHKYEDAHQQDGYYKLKDGKIYYWRTLGDWWDTTTHSHLELAVYCVSKEEDLEMNTKEVAKQVSCIEDLEVGMFFKTDMSHILITSKGFGKVCGLCVKSGMGATYTTDGFTCLRSWSYTYTGEYTPIVIVSEADIKIKELEATIALAQKQLQEYKEMK